MFISEKSIKFIRISLFLTFAILFVVIFSKSISHPAQSWYSTSWFYRKSITVGSTGSDEINYDALVVVDTASLVSGGKLQSDCDDLRFIDSDDSTVLSHWIEGGCNTSSTQVWVRIPSLPIGGKTIYMYYGYPSATNAEASWSGNFILFADATCPSGWTRNTSFDSKFIYGSTTYNTTGGSASSHNHGGSFSCTSSGGSSTGGVGGDVNNQCSNLPAHTHTISGTIAAADSTPSYITTILCNRSKLTDIGNLILLTDGTTPSGWTRATGFDGRLPYGSATYGTTGGNSTHTHTLSSVTAAAGTQTCYDGVDDPNPNSRLVSRPTHTHTVTTNTNNSYSNFPSYKSLLYIKAPSSTPSLGEAVISGFSALPPYGWTQYTNLNNYFVVGAATANLTAQGASTHTHSMTFSLAANTAYYSFNASSMPFAAYNHTHTGSCSYNTSYSLLPPYATLIYGNRKTSVSTTLGSEEIGNTAPTAPTVLYTEGSTNPVGVVDLTPEFSAQYNDPDSGDLAVYYQIEVNTASNFAGTVMWDSGKISMSAVTAGNRITDKSYAGTELTRNGTTYYWRIKLWDDSDFVSPVSATAQFTMNTSPTAPTDVLIEGVTNPVGVIDLTPEISAICTDLDTGNTCNWYEIEVNTQSDFLGTVMWDSGLVAMTATAINSRSPEISYAGTALTTDGSTYYVRIRFADNYGTVGAWSSVANFKMNTSPTAPTSLLTEGATNPTTVYDITPEFSAIFNDPDSGNTGNYYEIEVNTASNFGGTVMWDSGLLSMTATAIGARSPNISYAGTTLTGNATTYYWRIRFADNLGTTGAWSATAQFTISNNPDAPSGLYTEGTTNPLKVTDLTPEFSAIFTDIDGNTGNYYEIEVNTASNFAGTVMWDTGKLSTGPITNGNRSSDFSYAGTALTLNGITYYWRIRFWDQYDFLSNWSSTATFIMSGVPNTPTSLEVDGQTNPTQIDSMNPKFTAIYSDPNSDDASAYEIEVNSTSLFDGTVLWDTGQTITSFSSGSRSPEYTFAGTGLTGASGITYYWRIRFWDIDNNVSQWSTTATFVDSTAHFYLDGLQIDGLQLD